MRLPPISRLALAVVLAQGVSVADTAPYGFSAGEAGRLSARNDAQSLRITVGAGGLEIMPLRSPEVGPPEWALGLRLAAFGRGEQLEPVQRIAPRGTGAGVEYRRGTVTEWYVNAPIGLEQGFTLAAPPAGRAGQPLALEVEFPGAFVSCAGAPDRVRAGCGNLSLASAGGALSFGSLSAVDASGRVLAASMLPSAGGVRIEVNDLGARYPLVIDPLMSAPSWTQEGDLEGALAGKRMKIVADVNADGFDDVLVERTRPGSVSLHLGSPQGPPASPTWVFRPMDHGSQPPGAVVDYQDLYLGDAGDVNNDGFEDVVLGFPYHNGATGGGEGKAWVFLGSPSGLQATAVWTVEGEGPESNYGWWVSGAGDVNADGYDDILVGAPGFSDTVMLRGKAYLYLGSASGVSTTPAWSMVGQGDFASFGRQVSSAGDVNADGYGDFMVSAPGFGTTGSGAVLVVMGSAAGAQPDPLLLEISTPGAGFGEPMDAAGDVNGDGFDDVVVGAPGLDNEFSNQGGAFVFLGSAAGLATAPAWAMEGEFTDRGFGQGAAGARDVNGDGFDDILIGATPSSTFDVGQARVYLGSAAGVSYVAAWTKAGPMARAMLGYGAAGGGDVNGDGFDDVLIGAPWFRNILSSEGAVYLYSGCLETDGDGVCNLVDNCPDAPNSTQFNQDGDGRGNTCDCAIADPGLWSMPGPVLGFTLTADGGAGAAALSWQAPTDAGGVGSVFYDVVRTGVGSDFLGPASCLETDGQDTVAADMESPAEGGVFFYLVRPENSCQSGTPAVGTSSAGQPRVVRSCP